MASIDRKPLPADSSGTPDGRVGDRLVHRPGRPLLEGFVADPRRRARARPARRWFVDAGRSPTRSGGASRTARTRTSTTPTRPTPASISPPRPTSRSTPTGRRSSRRRRHTSPTGIAYNDLACAFWPVAAQRTPKAVTAAGAPPIVVVGSTGDPATPYAWAVALAKELDSGVLVTRNGEGHTAYRASSCVRDAIDAYLLKLTVPKDGLTCKS